jgi:Putative restriction endonuclease
MDSTGSFRFWDTVTMDLTMLAAFGSRRQPARPVVRLAERAMPRRPRRIPVDRAAARPTASSTARIDRRAKLQLYARHGIPHYWIVDPEARSIEAYVLSEGVFRVAARVAGADPGSLPPFPDLKIAAALLWP